MPSSSNLSPRFTSASRCTFYILLTRFASLCCLCWNDRPAYSVSFKYYPIPEHSIRDRAHRAGVASKHDAGYGGLVKTFLHEVLYDVKRVIYLDTDMLFLVDPYLLWRDFERYWSQSRDFMVAFPTLGERSTCDVVCTCIM